MLPCCPLLGRKRQGHPSFSSPFRWHVSIAGRGHCRPRCRLTGTGAQVRPSRERAPRVRASRAADASPPRTASSRGLHGRVRPPRSNPCAFLRPAPQTTASSRGPSDADEGAAARRADRVRAAECGEARARARGGALSPIRAERGLSVRRGKGFSGLLRTKEGDRVWPGLRGARGQRSSCGSAPHGGSGAVVGGPPEARCWHSVLTQVGTLCALWEASSSSATQGRRPCSPAAGASPTCALCPGAPSCTHQSRSPASPLWPPGFLPS